MSSNTFLLALTFGAAVLAAWTANRYPQVGPHSLYGAVFAVIVSGFVLHLTFPLAVALIHAPAPLAPVVGVIGIVLPTLTFGFLSALWALRACIGALDGSIR